MAGKVEFIMVDYYKEYLENLEDMRSLDTDQGNLWYALQNMYNYLARLDPTGFPAQYTLTEGLIRLGFKQEAVQRFVTRVQSFENLQPLSYWMVLLLEEQ